MRNLALAGVTVILGTLLLVGYVVIALAARTALQLTAAKPHPFALN